MRKLARWIRPGGYLALSVPDADCYEFRLFGSRWYALHLPNHLYHFTARTVSRLLEAAGWKVEQMYGQRFLGNLPGSLAHVCDDILGAPNLISKALIQLAGPKAYLLYLTLPLATVLGALRQTGRLTLWARRADA
jgi:hypothetical protein